MLISRNNDSSYEIIFIYIYIQIQCSFLTNVRQLHIQIQNIRFYSDIRTSDNAESQHIPSD